MAIQIYLFIFCLNNGCPVIIKKPYCTPFANTSLNHCGFSEGYGNCGASYANLRINFRGSILWHKQRLREEIWAIDVARVGQFKPENCQ